MLVDIDKNGNGVVKSFEYGTSVVNIYTPFTYNLNFGYEAQPVR